MVFWIPFAIAAAQGASQAYGQKQNADAINRAQRRFERMNAMLANEDALLSYTALAARRAQERTVLAGSLEQVSLDAVRRAGSASVAAGESGVRGNSVAALLNDFKIAQLKSEGNILDTEKYMQEQYQRDVDAVRAQATSRILGGQQQRVGPPNYTQIFVNAATQYMQASQQMSKANSYNGQQVNNANTPQLPAAQPGGGLDLPTN